MEQKQEERLSMKERMQLSMHSVMCKVCRNYERMSGGMERILERWSERSGTGGQEGLSSQRKAAILETLRRER